MALEQRSLESSDKLKIANAGGMALAVAGENR